MGSVLVLILAERKVLGRLQQRLGPMRTGPWGSLQTVADAVKLLVKEDLRPQGSDVFIFYLAPLMLFVPGFLIWAALPFTRDLVLSNLGLGLLYIVAVSTLSIVGMVMAGWASNNKYSLLGSARSAAQLVSYEIPLVVTVLAVGLLAQSLNLVEIVERQVPVPYILIQPLGFLLFLIAALAETGRIPFDIPQAESEIVGGPFVEYSGIRWGIFFLAEYAAAGAMAFLGALLFLGGWSGPFSDSPLWLFLKATALVLLFFLIRAPLPRLRVDQLMAFAWKVAIPLSFLNLLLIASALFYGWPQWLLGAVNWLVLVAVVAAFSWRRERRLARLRGRYAA
ncbi:MAG: NADH-quinone oxidoreductase subunit NuoH [Chloroflexi bacterium]|nr:NADH-quinone oxidoreductase subunit NuoH [Chloroflexota bacterium]